MELPIKLTVACPALVRTPMAEGLFTLVQADDDVLTELLPATTWPPKQPDVVATEAF